MNRFVIAAAVAISVVSGASNAFAGGLFGDIADVFVPGSGEILDDIHDQYKHANPEYGQWEEEMTNQVREDIGLEPHCSPVFDKWGNSVGCI